MASLVLSTLKLSST